MTNNTVYLLLGGNMGNRQLLLSRAVSLIGQKVGPVLKTSALYETAAWGNQAQPAFLNQALMAATPLSAPEILIKIREIELELGRERIEKWGSRTIDIDIIFFNREQIDLPGLSIPHPHMQDRNFVLVPLAEIAASYIHPVLQSDVATLQLQCRDTLGVHKYVL
ncbi:MAG: 2-amino-4-hydroxy-6-hydroxymethyldihydropteridine diphosphokinase [Sphingobacteriales bacterium]|nr:MAG: 2-amino-4-hydroxy-6-hydroxymethyldihydropteridine diphosphokinase [Sphingobacteriales bacterium]